MTARPREKSEAMINRRTNPGYYRGIKRFSRCSVRPQRLSRPFLFLAGLSSFLSSPQSHSLLVTPSNGIRRGGGL